MKIAGILNSDNYMEFSLRVRKRKRKKGEKSVTLSLGHFTTKKYLFGVIYNGTAISGTILGMHRTVRCYDSLV